MSDKLPTMKEIDAMVEGLHGSTVCAVLSADLLEKLEALNGPPPATGIKRTRLLAQIKAIRAEMKALDCGPGLE